MTEKVKLPREVATAIGDMKAKGLLLNEIVERHINKDHILVNNVECVVFLSTDTLIRALYIGYEVESTPEDKVRELYEGEIKYQERNNHGNLTATGAIKKTLDLLNIKIDGVNS